MISANLSNESKPKLLVHNPAKVRNAAHCVKPTVFTDIYNENINMAVWQRNISTKLQSSVDDFLTANNTFQRNITVPAKSILPSIRKMLPEDSQPELSEDIAELVDMFCYLFELKRAGLRLRVLDRAMCPRFHVDNVPCRLVTTYQGIATQWLSHQVVNRTKLGTANAGLPDDQSGLFANQDDIQQLNQGDVAILKGELWDGNQGAGLVHRSPALSHGERRLLLTLDFSI